MAPKYRTGLEWEQHILRPACKAAGNRMSFIEAIHDDPSRLHFPPQSTLNPHRVFSPAPHARNCTPQARWSLPVWVTRVPACSHP